MSPREIDALIEPPAAIEGGHFRVILEPDAQRQLLEYLHDR